jgi:hypothetical protein
MPAVSRSALLALAIFLVLEASVAGAATIVLDPTARGAYRGDTGAMWTGGSGTPTGNYLTGLVAPGLESRGFLIFDLSSVTSTITSATLGVQLSALLCCSVTVGAPALFEVLSLFDVTTSLASVAGGTGGLAAFADLGSGTVFTGFQYDTSLIGTVVDIPLNAAAVAALNAASGPFGFGATVTSISGTSSQIIFGDTQGLISRLRLETPEPLVGALLLFGIAAIRTSRQL